MMVVLEVLVLCFGGVVAKGWASPLFSELRATTRVKKIGGHSCLANLVNINYKMKDMNLVVVKKIFLS